MACDELRLHSTFETLDSNLKGLPEHLTNLVAHIVARASVSCGENLVKTALACILCSRHPPYPSQLQRMINIWLSVTSDQVAPQVVAFFNGDENAIPEVDQNSHFVLTTMALNILLSQLQPLIVGFESTDESCCGLEVSGTEQENGGRDDVELESKSNLCTSEGLRLCSIEITDVVRRLCFSSGGPISGFCASRRLGYTTRVGAQKCSTEPPSLSSFPTELQTYRLLLCEHIHNFKDKVYYAFRAKKLDIAVSTLSDISYIRQKALNNDVPGLIEEFLGFDTPDPDVKTGWSKIIDTEQNSVFSMIRHFVLRSGHILAKFPRLTGQLLLDSIPMLYEGPLRVELEKSVKTECSFAISRYNALSTNYLRNMEMIWGSETITSPTALASNGHNIVACGASNGSITLINLSSGKVLNTRYGHSAAVNAIVFIVPETNALAIKCTLLYSVSADATSCLWKLVPSNGEKNGLLGVRLMRISGHHNRAITACAWNSQKMHLVTAGLDGLVCLFAMQSSLDDSGDGVISASGYDLESFKKPHHIFSTKYQPISAMVLVHDKIVVGCWNGTLWIFPSDATQNTNPTEDVDTVLLVGSECGPSLKQTRDVDYCRQWAGVRGRHAAIVTLAYSGPECDVIACADFVGEVTLINATTFECIIYLERASRHVLNHVSGRLCFLKDGASGDCLLAHTGSFKSVSGAICLWNIERPYKFDSVTVPLENMKSSSICAGANLTESIIVFGDHSGGITYFNHKVDRNLIQLCSPHKRDTSRIQALDCVLYHGKSSFALIVYGSASGDVTFANFSTKTDSNGDLKLGKLAGTMKEPFSVWPHAYGHQKAGGGEAGGTLAITVSAPSGFAISGGGDSACCFHMFEFTDLNSIGCNPDTIHSDYRAVIHSAGVSALASAHEVAVSGGKDGLLVIYRVNNQNDLSTVEVLESVPQAHRDWITCIAIEWEDCQRCVIVSGGNDHAIGVWLLNIGDNIHFSQIWFGTEHVHFIRKLSFQNSLLTSVSADGMVVVWEVTSSSIRKLRHFTLSTASEGGELLMINLAENDELKARSSRESQSDDLDILMDVAALFGEPTELPHETFCDVDETVMENRALSRLSVVCIYPDGTLDMSTISPFLPHRERPCEGHSNVKDSSAIHLASSMENATLISASTSHDESGEMCLWRFGNTEPEFTITPPPHCGAITAIKARNGYFFVASDDGQLSVWRAKGGRQLIVEGFVPCGCINDLEAVVSLQNGMIHEATIFLLINQSRHELTLSASTDSKLVFTSSRVDLPVELEPYSLMIPTLTSGPTKPTFVMGTRNGLLVNDDLICKGNGLVTSVHENGIDCGYIGLRNGTIELFTDGCKLSSSYPSKIGRTVTHLQVMYSQGRSVKYLLASGTRKVGKTRPSFLASFVWLCADPYTTLSKYMLPKGIIVTAFNAVEITSESAGTSGFLVLVGGSDGILRHLYWTLSQPTKEPKLLGYFPTGKKITQICMADPDHFAIGYSNGDVGIYRFVNSPLIR